MHARVLGIVRCFAVAVAGLAALAASFAAGAQNQAPELPSGWTDKRGHARHWMVAAANPHAVDAGYRVLAKGGSAVDAAIAMQLVLGLTEPQSSGIGGGGFMLVHDGAAAPARLRRPRDGARGAHARSLPQERPPARFLRRGARRQVGRRARHRAPARGRASQARPPAVAAPVRAGHRARRERLCRCRRACIGCSARAYITQPRLRAYFFDGNGKVLPVGTVLRNPAYAKTLRAIAAGGADAFYKGAIARDIVETVTSTR